MTQVTLTVPFSGPPPVISDQTLRIGAMTTSTFSGRAPTYSGPGTVFSISGGNSASYVCNSSTGKIRPASNGAATTGHTFTYSITGPGGVDTATITISAPANTYSAATGADIDYAVIDHVNGSAVARTIELLPGVVITDGVNNDSNPSGIMDENTFLNRDFSAKRLTVTSEDTGNRATVAHFRFRVQGSKAITFNYLNLTWPSVSGAVGSTGNTGASWFYDADVATTSDIIIDNCDFDGPSGTLLETLTGGTAWNLYDWYSGYVASNGSPFPTPVSFSAASNTTFTNNTARRVHIGWAIHLKGPCTIENNQTDYAYYYLAHISGPATYDSGAKSIKNNTVGIAFGSRWNVGAGPHADSLIAVNGRISNTVIDGHVVYMGAVGTDSNGDDLQGPGFGPSHVTWENVVVRRCVAGIQSQHAVSFYNCINVMVDQCTVIENNPTSPVGQQLKPQYRFGEGTSSGVVHIRDSIGANGTIYTNGSAEVTTEGNLLGVVAANVSTYYTGPFNATSRAATIAAFTPKVGSAAENIGAVTSGGALRTGNRAPAVPAKPTLATAAASAITVTPNVAFWDGATDAGGGGTAITSRDLRYSTDQTNWTVMTGVTTPQTTPSLSPTTLYYVQTRDVNAVGAGAWSKSASITTT